MLVSKFLFYLPLHILVSVCLGLQVPILLTAAYSSFCVSCSSRRQMSPFVIILSNFRLQVALVILPKLLNINSSSSLCTLLPALSRCWNQAWLTMFSVELILWFIFCEWLLKVNVVFPTQDSTWKSIQFFLIHQCQIEVCCFAQELFPLKTQELFLANFLNGYNSSIYFFFCFFGMLFFLSSW